MSGQLQMGDGTKATCPSVRWYTNKFNIFAGSGLDDTGMWHLYDDENLMDLMYYDPKTHFGCARGGNHIEVRTDDEGGNLTLQGPSGKQSWEIDNWNNDQLRAYVYEGSDYYQPLTLDKEGIRLNTGTQLKVYGVSTATIGSGLDGTISCAGAVINDVVNKLVSIRALATLKNQNEGVRSMTPYTVPGSSNPGIYIGKLNTALPGMTKATQVTPFCFKVVGQGGSTAGFFAQQAIVAKDGNFGIQTSGALDVPGRTSIYIIFDILAYYGNW